MTAKDVEKTSACDTSNKTVKDSDSAAIDAGPKKRKSRAPRVLTRAKTYTNIPKTRDADSIDDAKLKRILALNSSGWRHLLKIMKDRRINSSKERNATIESLHASSRGRAKQH